MSNSMKRVQEELKSSLNTADETGNNLNYGNEELSEELIERIQVDKSPYTIIGNKERGYFLSIGKYRLTEPKPYPDDVEKELNDEKWNIIYRTILVLMEGIEEYKHMMEGIELEKQK